MTFVTELFNKLNCEKETSVMNAVLEKVTSKLAKPNVCCVIDGGLIMLKNCVQNKHFVLCDFEAGNGG